MIRDTLPKETIEFVMKRDKGVCRYCGDEASEIDHITPWAKGGDHDEDNLVACCRKCNSMARNKLFDTFLEKRIYLLTMICAGKYGRWSSDSQERQLRKLLKIHPGVGRLSRYLSNALTSFRM